MVTDDFRAEIRRRDAAGDAWLDGLPRVWDDLRHRWKLTLDAAPRPGASALVLPVRTATGRAALKLISPVMRAADEAMALETFGGRRAVRLLDADLTAGALLLEWLDGPALIDHPDPSTAMRIAGDIAGQLARTPAPPGVPTLASGSGDWQLQLREQHETAQQIGTGVPDELFARAVGIIADLGSDPTTTLTHGDLSLTNIVRAGADRWVAIDPYLIVGTAANEAHTVVRSHLDIVAGDPDPPELLAAWTRDFSTAADVDVEVAQRLSFARYVASYYWESQSGGSPRNVQNLRAAVFITADLLTPA